MRARSQWMTAEIAQGLSVFASARNAWEGGREGGRDGRSPNGMNTEIIPSGSIARYVWADIFRSLARQFVSLRHLCFRCSQSAPF